MRQRKVSEIDVDGSCCLSAFTYQGLPQDEPFRDKRLMRMLDGMYRVITIGHFGEHSQEDVAKIITPAGWWDCVISVATPKVLHVRREREAAESRARAKFKLPDGAPGKKNENELRQKIDALSGRGHSSIAQGGAGLMASQGHPEEFASGRAVLFAGSLLFGGTFLTPEQTEPGVLVRWENKSGHYMIGFEQKHRTVSSALLGNFGRLLGGLPKAPSKIAPPQPASQLTPALPQVAKDSTSAQRGTSKPPVGEPAPAQAESKLLTFIRRQTSTLPLHWGLPLLPMEKFEEHQEN